MPRVGRVGLLLIFCIPVLLIASRLAGQIRLFKSSQLMEYQIVYMEPWGEAQADASGFVCFHDRLVPGSSTRHKDLRLPQKYWGSYPLFYPESPIRYQIRLRNNSPKALKKLRILAIPKILSASGAWDSVENFEDLPDWFIDTIESKQVIVLNGEMMVNGTKRKAGLIQTYLQIRQVGEKNMNSSDVEALLADATQAAVWCAAP